MDRKAHLLGLHDLFPIEKHPLWRAVLQKDLAYEQVIEAEVQHWIRTRAGQALRKSALTHSQSLSPKIYEQLLETYLEECTDKEGPSHLDLIERLVTTGGRTRSQLERAIATPGNAAAIAIYRDITDRGAGCHMLGAGAVEYYYSYFSPKIFAAYTEKYGMTEEQAKTYQIHGPMDRIHAERAFSILDEAVRLHGWEHVEMSVRDAFVATSLHYDGMLQAATKTNDYWNGRT